MSAERAQGRHLLSAPGGRERERQRLGRLRAEAGARCPASSLRASVHAARQPGVSTPACVSAERHKCYLQQWLSRDHTQRCGGGAESSESRRRWAAGAGASAQGFLPTVTCRCRQVAAPLAWDRSPRSCRLAVGLSPSHREDTSAGARPCEHVSPVAPATRRTDPVARPAAGAPHTCATLSVFFSGFKIQFYQ